MNRIIYYAVALLVVAACNRVKYDKADIDHITEGSPEEVSAMEDSVLAELKDTAETFQTQAEINEAVVNNYYEYVDSVEEDYQRLLKVLPQYKGEFQKEKAVWEKYMDAVKAVARCVDTGSSTPMYVSDVLSLGTLIRAVPISHLYLHTQGKDLPYSQTTFTPAMIAQAYSDFIDAVREDEYQEQKAQYVDALRKEQKSWENLVNCRKDISQKLSGDLKQVFDIGTNQMMRTKLLQLKNQNQNLGMVSGDVIECALPDDCSDKELLEYPGFHKVWEKYLED